MTVTEASPETQDPQIASILSDLRRISGQVTEIDTELGSEDQGPVARRNKLAADYVEKFKTDEKFNSFISTIVGKIKEHFTDSNEVLSAVYTEVHNKLGSEYGKTVKEFLDAQVKAIPVPETPTIPAERKEELINKRSNLVNIFKLQKEMLKYYDFLELPSDIEEPSGRRGAIGPRGANFIREYAFYVGDEDTPRTVLMKDKDGNKVRQNVNLSNIATTVCKDLNWKTKQLKDFIVDSLSLTTTPGKTENSPPNVDPGSSWEVMLPEPVGKKLRAVEVSSSTVAVDDSEDEDEDDDNDTVETTPEDDMFAGTQS